ncbi:hypothetical protein HHL28_14515 [Aerophototrophica crusticola]|uniref:Uncharacterized protein n=1 Tax=Aerophototrophica crusticola TaxID=1709002 RepID=A0A858R9U7_9PROT|nr:hypothetical protein HHL28_14515 [Rhodospirillaceae bacterium B3]
MPRTTRRVARRLAPCGLLSLVLLAAPAGAQQGNPIPPDLRGGYESLGRTPTPAPPATTRPAPAPVQPVPAYPPPAATSPGTLGQIPSDYELHGELVLVSGQLEGFEQACGFGLKPDRQELLDWYAHYRLARSLDRLRGIYELGVSLGREGPCTAEQNQALVRQWRTLLNRTRTYVEQYRKAG